MEGQMTIFDFLEYLPEGKEKRMAEIKKQNEGDIISPAQKYYINTGKTDYWSQDIVFVKGEPIAICKFSGHVCNKEELWNVASSLDDVECKKICCRQCKERLCGARCNGSDAKEYKPFYSTMIGDEFIPYIVDALLSNSLLEPFVTSLVEQLKDVKNIHLDGAKEVHGIFEKTLFKMTNTQFFKCKEEMFYLKKPNDNPPFRKSGVCVIGHCGKDSGVILANVLVVDIADEILERVNSLNVEKETFEELHKRIPWARQCQGHPNECFEHPSDGICTATCKCSRRMEYKTLNQYYLEQINCRALNNPVDGSQILCEKTKTEADELIKKWRDYYGIEKYEDKVKGE